MERKIGRTRYRLVIRQDLLLRGFARLANGEATLIWGRILRSYHRRGCDLIVRELVYSNTLPSGDRFTPLFDWLVIHRADEVDEPTIMTRLTASNVRLGQMMVYFQPGIGDQFEGWVGALCEHDKISPLNEILLVGPGLNRIRRVKSHSRQQEVKLPAQSERRLDHWSRLRGAIGNVAFARFRNTEIVLIGCGRLGSLMAAKLVRMGIKRITLVDPDKLEAHNRDMTLGNRPSDVGKNKAIVLAKTLHRIRPNARISAIPRTVQDDIVLDRIRCAPVLITCIDNDEARRYVARISSDLMRIHLDCGTIVASSSDEEMNVIAADIRLILPGSCLACVGGLQTDENAEINVESSWTSGGRIGSLPSINSIAVGTALQIYLDFLAERIQHSFWQRIRWSGVQGLTASAGPVPGDRNCAICGKREITLHNSRP